ncbi:MAG: hypothetical protein QXL46_03305 [Nitrososphaerales archaeon]
MVGKIYSSKNNNQAGTENQEQVSSPSTTTTTPELLQNTKTKLRIASLSDITIQLLKEMYKKGYVYPPEFAKAVGKPSKHIRVYLHRLKEKGLAFYKNSYWFPTDEAKDLLIFPKLQEDDSKLQEDYNELKDDNRNIQTVKDKTLTMMLIIEDFLRETILEEEEVVVLKALVNHYNRTARLGKAQPFIKLRGISEDLAKYGFGELTFEQLNASVATLKSLGICYFMKDKENPGFWKLGLYKAFIQKHSRMVSMLGSNPHPFIC